MSEQDNDALQAFERIYDGLTQYDDYEIVKKALTSQVDIEGLIPDFVENCENAPLLENRDHGLLSCFIDHLREKGLI